MRLHFLPLLLSACLLAPTRACAGDRGVKPNVERGAKAQVEELLEKMSAAKTWQQRQPIARKLYECGETAIPHLRAALEQGKPEIKYLAASILQTIEYRAARNELPAVEDKALRVRAELIVHGERMEGEKQDKFIGSSFRLWLGIENLSGKEVTLAKPEIKVPQILFPISRWYEEDTDGEPWDGKLKGKEQKSILVIGDSKGVKPNTEIKAVIEFNSLVIKTNTKALAELVGLEPMRKQPKDETKQ